MVCKFLVQTSSVVAWPGGPRLWLWSQTSIVGSILGIFLIWSELNKLGILIKTSAVIFTGIFLSHYKSWFGLDFVFFSL